MAIVYLDATTQIAKHNNSFFAMFRTTRSMHLSCEAKYKIRDHLTYALCNVSIMNTFSFIHSETRNDLVI